MPIDVIMPQMGESIAEGTLVKWLKKEGDQVQRDENLFEISTDKVDAEIPSPAAGTLGGIVVQEGETVAVGVVVAKIYQEGEVPAGGPAPATVTEEAQAPPAPEPQPDGAPSARSTPAGAPVPEARAEPEPASTAPAEGEAAIPRREPGRVESQEGDGKGAGRIPSKAELRRQRSSPLVRNIAAEHGVDLAEVQGTGLSGRVTKRDILAYVEAREKAPAAAASGVEPSAPRRPAAPEVPPVPRPAPSELERPTPAAIEPAAVAAMGEPPRPFGDKDRVEVVPMSIMRRKIGEHMIQSRRTSAHVTTFFEIDMTRVAELRRLNKPRFLEDSGVNLTYLPFIIRAVVAGVKEWPVLNSSVWGENIVLKKDINIGMAVALPQGKEFGLIVPVIKHADELSLVGLARTANDLAERARTKKLLPEEVQGGTFTITNPGVFGSLMGTPIINQPQVAILGVGEIEKRVKVVGPDDSIGVRTCAYFSISYDHRVVDGATADHFMGVVKETLENFSDPSLKES
jgi:2-oxoglutarate dehydrogenase E2 component (dihydrolipoamide succinyltransferase)